MKKIRQIIYMLSVFAVLSLLVVTTAFADSITKLNRVQASSDSVKVSLEDVNYLTVKSFQVSLQIEGNVKFQSINFATSIKSNAKTVYKYNEGTNVLDIYVTGKKNLLTNKKQLEIGTIKVEGGKGEEYDIVPNAKKSTVLKLVSEINKNRVDNDIEASGDDGFTFGQESNSGSGSGGSGDTGSKPEEKPEKPVLSKEQEKASKEYKKFMKIGSYNLSSKNSCIKSVKDVKAILNSKERKTFLAAWKKLSSKEKKQADMKALQKDYLDAITYLHATQSMLDYTNAISKGATAIAKNAKLATKQMSLKKGSKRKNVIEKYRAIGERGETPKNSKRTAWLKARYETTKSFLEGSILLGNYDKDYNAAKTIAKKNAVTKKYKSDLNGILKKMTHSPTQKKALEKEMKRRLK